MAQIHDSAIVDYPAEIGSGTKIWHWSHVCTGAHIGENCTIGQNVYVASTVVIGRGCKIQNNVSLYDGIILEDGVFVGPSAVFTNVNNPRAAIERKSEFRKTILGKGATVGANATILCGLTIGRYALVGAGAVVTKDVDDFKVVVGNPARVVGTVSKEGEVTIE